MYLATTRTLGRVTAPWTSTHHLAGAIRSISVAGKSKAETHDNIDTTTRQRWKRWTEQENTELSRLMAPGVRVVDTVASLPGRSLKGIYQKIRQSANGRRTGNALTDEVQGHGFYRRFTRYGWTEEEKRRMKELREAGWTWSRIAQEVGRGAPHDTVRYACISMYGDPFPSKQPKPWSPEERTLLESLRSQGLTPRAIQQHLPHRSFDACRACVYEINNRHAAGGSYKRSRWQQDEIKVLREGIQRGLSWSEIAIKLQRQRRSVQAKAHSLSLLPPAHYSKSPASEVENSMSGERSKTTTVESGQQLAPSQIATAPRAQASPFNDVKRPKLVNRHTSVPSTISSRPYSAQQTRKFFTPEEDSLIRQLAEQKMTAAAIAEKLGRPRDSIYARARVIETKPSLERSFYSEHEDQILRELRARRTRTADIASKLQRPICSVKRRIGILGLEKRQGRRDLNRTYGPSPGTIPRKTLLSDKELEGIRQLRSNGAHLSCIAERFNLSASRMSQICHERGFNNPSNVLPWTFEDDILICQLLLARHTWEEIAARLGRPIISIKRRAYYRGIGKKHSPAEILLAARTVYLRNTTSQPLDEIAAVLRRKESFLQKKLSGWWQETFGCLVDEDPQDWSKSKRSQIYEEVHRRLLARFESPALNVSSKGFMSVPAGI